MLIRMRIGFMAGPPGSGKGTQSPIIKDEYCLCHLATGDMLRASVAAKTPLGIKAKEAMDKVKVYSYNFGFDKMFSKIDWKALDNIKKERKAKNFIHYSVQLCNVYQTYANENILLFLTLSHFDLLWLNLL